MGACFVKICVDLIWFQKMEVTIRPHSLWSLCRVATTSSIPWDKIVEIWSWSWNWQSSQRYWPISQRYWPISQILRSEFLIDSWVAEGQQIFWTFSNNLTAHAQICMIRLKSFEHSNKKKSVKTFIKAVKRLSSINVHFVMHGQSDSEESFSSVTSSAHGNHDKSNNLWKLIYRAKKQGECLNKFLKYRMLTTRHVE